MTPIERMLAAHEIEQNLYKYSRGVDRKDWDAVRQSYHEDGYDFHGGYEGDVDGLIQWMMNRHERIQYSIHLITNISVEFLDDLPSDPTHSVAHAVTTEQSALVESYFTAYQRVTPPEGEGESVDNQSIGRYIDHVVRRDSQWRVLRRTVVFDFYFSSPAVDSPRLPAAALRSMRDEQDMGVRIRKTMMLGKD